MERIGPLGWYVVVYFDAADLVDLRDSLVSLPVPLVIDHMARPDVSPDASGDEFATVLELLRARPDTWCKVTCPERLSLSGPPELRGERSPYLDGNIYFLAKWGAALGLSFQQMAGSMTGMSEDDYRDMMLHGGRSVDGNRIADQVIEAHFSESVDVTDQHSRITASAYTSHVPAIGAAWDQHKRDEPYWKPVFDGYVYAKEYLQENPPDVIFLVYNDHATAFDQTLIPTFVLGTGAHYEVADEGYGARPVPGVEGDPEFAAHLAHSLIRDDFDLTLVNEMTVDHGLTVPLSLMFGDVERWPCKVIPFHVNVVQYPVPSGRRCFELGRALRRAIESYDKSLDVQVWGTGGMSHQLQGPRAGLINREWDNRFLDALIADPRALAEVPHLEYVEEAGSEGIELVMWLIARGAMSDIDDGGEIEVRRRFYHVPASNTAVGHLIIDNHPQAQTPAEKE